jgi:hypothetical protein
VKSRRSKPRIYTLKIVIISQLAGIFGQRFLMLAVCSLLFLNTTSLAQTGNLPQYARSELREKLFSQVRQTGNSSQDFPDNQGIVRKKSPGLAAFASLVVPGLGELYAGRYDVGKYSTIAEVSLWIFYAATEIYSEQVRNDAINYAKIYSGAQVDGKPSQFFVDIGNFLNTNDYNILKIKEGQNALIYTSPSYQWQWQSDANRAEFKRLRIKADTFLNYGRYTAAVIIFNHIFSAFDAARLAVGVNASAATSLDGSDQSSGIYLKLSKSF